MEAIDVDGIDGACWKDETSGSGGGWWEGLEMVVFELAIVCAAAAAVK